MTKLVCIKCGGTEWSPGMGLIKTVMPPVYVSEYICAKCGNKQVVETPTKIPTQEVILSENSIVRESSTVLSTDTTKFGHTGVKIMSDTDFKMPGKKNDK